jgi:signal transduction histidine kinase
MSLIDKFRPAFLSRREYVDSPFKYHLDFRNIWKWTIVLTSAVALLPLIVITVVDYQVTQQSIESEIQLRSSRVASNVKRTLYFFLTERRAALDFVIHTSSYEKLVDAAHLADILENLKKGFGGFVDLGVIDSRGVQMAYAGPYDLQGRNYSRQRWFGKVQERGIYISNVFLGYRNTPHLVVAVKSEFPGGGFFVLRATLDTERFNEVLAGLELCGNGDAFIINHQGVLQTPSRFHGNVLEHLALAVPPFSERTEVYEDVEPSGEAIFVGHAYISDTPFVLMIVQQKRLLMAPWQKTRMELIGFLAASITIILLVIFGVATYLVNNMYRVDQKRLEAFHQVEYANKMASLGRLAAGVAHEINNPLAIINEKAGLIQDIFTFGTRYVDANKLSRQVESILESVDRCGAITRRLLRFARHMDVDLEPIDLKEIVEEVLGFLGKEAEYRCIQLKVDVDEHIPPLESDRGKLQQIFLNLFNNAFAAMKDGGRLEITALRKDRSHITVKVADNGCGISEKDINRVFEPFFSTKQKDCGTGLGLSITYGLIKELGGTIEVESKVGEGTVFTITLPLAQEEKKNDMACIT